jgi:hypothetical protein
MAARLLVIRDLNQAGVIGVGQNPTSDVQLPGDESPPGASPGLHGLIETTSNFGVAGDKTG